MAELDINSPPVRLIISLLLSYPISIVYSLVLVTRSRNIKLFYHLIFGIALTFFNYGFDIYHYLLVCLICYATLHFLSIKAALVVNFIFPMAYLIVGCYVTQIGSNYSITWTLPQCVLTLRLIAVTFDVFDGIENQRRRKKTENAQLVNPDSAVESAPPFLEFLTHNFFPPTVLVGPLIPYRQFVTYIESDVNHLPKCWTISLSRLLVGVLYLVIYQLGSDHFPSEYLTGEHYSKASFLWRASLIALVAKIAMCKYLASWLISEGACIASGVAYDGQSYYSCANVFISKFELTPTFGGIIKSFNLKTNAFAAKYVYKRLKFFGNKHVSQGLTLLFLSVWHGIDSGYFITFSMEFLIMKMETDAIALIERRRQSSAAFKRVLDNGIVRLFCFILAKAYVVYLLGYSFVPMMLIKYEFWYPVLRQVFFYGHIITISWISTSIVSIAMS